MIKSLIIGMAGMTLLMVIWAIVQYYWGKMFSSALSDEDVLAVRKACDHCDRASACGNRSKPDSPD
ncbi:MAG: hypothetical protein R3E36_08455 [Nitrosomonas sp.]|jgi:hypothetical protein|nr:hypothetical protein [Nitrosomonas sp.]MDR4652740.1 hypothetical protein [Nitrosomonas sp.]